MLRKHLNEHKFSISSRDAQSRAQQGGSGQLEALVGKVHWTLALYVDEGIVRLLGRLRHSLMWDTVSPQKMFILFTTRS